MNTLTTIFAIIGFAFMLFCIICFLIGVIDYLQNYPCGFCCNREDCPYCDCKNITKVLENENIVYCDRNICISNEYNGISCDECEVTKSQEPSVEILKTEESDDNGTKYLNINVSDGEVKRNPDVVRLCSDVGILEYVRKEQK